VYYDFTLDSVDLNGRVMSIKWDQKPGAAAFVAGDLVVDIVAQADRTTVLVTPFTTALPVADGTVQTYFLAPSTAAVALRIKSIANAATDATVVISDVVVGPNVQVQGSAIGAWKAYTPKWTASSTQPVLNNGTITGFYCEVGDSIELQVALISGTTTTYGTGSWLFSLPDAFSINTAKLSSDALSQNLGSAVATITASQNVYDGIVQYASAGNVYVLATDAATPAGWGVAVPTAWSSTTANQRVGISCTIPVNELSSNVTLANRAVEEYAWNGGTWDADDSTTFGNGPSGAAITGALTAQTTKVIRFNSPIQSTDTLILEFSTDRVKWMQAPCFVGYAVDSYNIQNTTTYGPLLVRVATPSTDLAIIFGQYASVTTGVYASAGSAWEAGSYYRVRKVSGGASVGYPISSANIVTTNSSGAGILFEDSTSFSSTFTFNGTGGTSGAVTVYCNRIGKVATIFVSATVLGTSGTSSTALVSNTAIPVGFRPVAVNYTSCLINDNAATLAALGMAGVSTAGVITIYKTPASTAWTNGAAVSGGGPFSISYPVA
jgi:hypothetical protein